MPIRILRLLDEIEAELTVIERAMLDAWRREHDPERKMSDDEVRAALIHQGGGGQTH